MHEAIDYNALSWIRQELGETINLARMQLEEFAADTANEMPLQVVRRNCTKRSDH